ncbi:hypothetical protein LRD18_02995 [Halorhodospira halochloris]|uniref:hypothetical protein n=1 Tax=Halorhodospira halochloris TaxID=1052 RepID=UPI001EE85B06|nr:hypothetical protein [Halorhodospira halochloris]MCG5529842.1 hypothetical protein [Halorhodospira halochloris]
MRYWIVFCFLFFVSPHLLADRHYVTVPSGLHEGQKVTVLGGNYSPNTRLQLDIIYEKGPHKIDTVVTNSEGKLEYVIDEVRSGENIVRIYLESGARLAETRMVVAK